MSKLVCVNNTHARGCSIVSIVSIVSHVRPTSDRATEFLESTSSSTFMSTSVFSPRTSDSRIRRTDI